MNADRWCMFALGSARALVADLVRQLPEHAREAVAGDVESLDNLIALALEREPQNFAAPICQCGHANNEHVRGERMTAGRRSWWTGRCGRSDCDCQEFAPLS